MSVCIVDDKFEKFSYNIIKKPREVIIMKEGIQKIKDTNTVDHKFTTIMNH